MGGELRFQLWLLLGKTDRKPSVRQTGSGGIRVGSLYLWVQAADSIPTFSTPVLPASTFTWTTLSFMTFSLFLESVDQVPASGPLHVLCLLPQTFQGTDWLFPTSGFSLNVTSSEWLPLTP